MLRVRIDITDLNNLVSTCSVYKSLENVCHSAAFFFCPSECVLGVCFSVYITCVFQCVYNVCVDYRQVQFWITHII